MSYLDRIRTCQVYSPDKYWPFCAQGLQIGRMTPEFARTLSGYSDVFIIENNTVQMAAHLNDFKSRSEAIAKVVGDLNDQGKISGWRGETFSVGETFASSPLLEIERAAVAQFGCCGYGVHINGYVRDGDTLKMWIGKRSQNKQISPGKLDHIAAGGQPGGISLRDNVIKESYEEAGIPPDLARQAVSVGTVSFLTERPEGLRDDFIFVYDLELPASFVPENTDGEVESFHLWPISEVIYSIQNTEDFKFSVALVIIDFLVRHGYIDADHPDYQGIVSGLHI